MLKNYLTSVLRYVSKNKASTFINILGLAIGMMACMLITQFVLHEFSYDNFHTKKDRIFRLILFLAWINYINLSTAKSIERAREVGVRKVMGSFRAQLVRQFLFEAVLLNTIAVALAILLVVIISPSFSELTGRELGYALLQRNLFWVAMIAVILGGAFVALITVSVHTLRAARTNPATSLRYE